MTPPNTHRALLHLVLVTMFVTADASARQTGKAIAPHRIFELAAITKGQTVCEIGAGDGTLTLAAAKIVGPDGRVYANELGDDRLKKLEDQVRSSGLPQITVVMGDVTNTNFPESACDALFMKDVYHHLSEPAAMNAAIVRALKPGGRVAVMDFTPPDREAERPADRAKDGKHGILPETLTREMSEAGLQPESSETGARWFIVVLSKPHPRAAF